MKKLLMLLTTLLLIISLSACITDVAKEEWCTITIGKTDYGISFGIESEYVAKENSKNENCVDFYKNGEKLMGGEFIIGELPSGMQTMIQCSSLIEERKDDNATYYLYEYSQYGTILDFVIVDIENKNTFFTFETNAGLEKIEPLFNTIKIE